MTDDPRAREALAELERVTGGPDEWQACGDDVGVELYRIRDAIATVERLKATPG